ncbi:MAG: hypothetical protein R3F43_31620, partial [bacterium]
LDFDVQAASTRAAMLELQVFGTLAAWVSSREVARKLDPDPQRAAVEAGALVVRLAEADRAGWETRMWRARVRSAVSGAKLYRREIAQKCGVKRRSA